jgi:hypothetical protein
MLLAFAYQASGRRTTITVRIWEAKSGIRQAMQVEASEMSERDGGRADRTLGVHAAASAACGIIRPRGHGYLTEIA